MKNKPANNHFNNSLIEQDILSRLRRGTIETFVLKVSSIGLIFLMNSTLSRFIGPKDYGTFSYVLALAGLLSIIVLLGWPIALMRFISQYIEQQQWSLLRGVILKAHQITFIFSVLVALFLWGITYWQQIHHDLAISLRFAALLLPFLAFSGLRRKAFQGLQLIKASIIPDEIILPILVITWVYLFVITNAFGALLAYICAMVLVSLFGGVWLWHSLPIQVLNVQTKFQTRKWLAVTLPMMLGLISQITINRIDVLILGVLVDMESVGLYSAANRIAALNTFALTAVDTIAAPLLAAAFHGTRFEQFKSIFRKTMLWSTAGALPMFTIMILWPQNLLIFFGSEFIRGALLLQILAVGQFVNAMTGSAGFALLMTNREREFAWLTGIVSLGNLIGNLFAISIFGAVGAAVVSSVSVIIINGLMCYRVQSICKIRKPHQGSL